MAVIVVALVLGCSGLWSRAVFVMGQTCVNESNYTEQVLDVGQPHQLQCPLVSTGSPEIQLTWLKNCLQLPNQDGKTYLEFTNASVEDRGNYTCRPRGGGTDSFTVHLIVKESLCSKAPKFKPNRDLTKVWGSPGSTVKLSCTALLYCDPSQARCDATLQWSKSGRPLTNHTLYPQNTSSWSPGVGKLMVDGEIEISLREAEDFGLYSCTIRNTSSTFSVQDSNSFPVCGVLPHSLRSHGPEALVGCILLLIFGVPIAAVLYFLCHLNIKLWYKNSYGDYELNDGRFYDAYVSYVNNDYDRNFVNSILKPHLENKNGYKVHLNDNDILPGSEPSADLLLNMRRSRRFIVLLSHAYLEQDWCCNNLKQGFLQLLELCQRVVIITLEGQSIPMSPHIRQLLSEHQNRITLLTWKKVSVKPSSIFWKELALAMPRRVVFYKSAGDPQTLLHGDKDPMLTLDPDYSDSRSDADPEIDLGLGLPVYKDLDCPAPVLPAAPLAAEPEPSDIDVSDLETRNYGARSDFYCLVTEEDV